MHNTYEFHNKNANQHKKMNMIPLFGRGGGGGGGGGGSSGSCGGVCEIAPSAA